MLLLEFVLRKQAGADKSCYLLQISAVMDRFETQFEDLDVATGYYENATSSATAVATPQDEVDKLMGQVADEAGVEQRVLRHNLRRSGKISLVRG
jgi:charged multivesicular body protein 1